jgi:hypothetical protein
MSAADAAGSADSKYTQKKAAFLDDDAKIPPLYAQLLQIQNDWFSGRNYADKMELLRDAAAGPGPAEDFVRYFLALRRNVRTRLPFAQFCVDVRRDGKDEKGRLRHYWRALSARIWEHYLTAPRMLFRLYIFLSTSIEKFLSTSIEILSLVWTLPTFKLHIWMVEHSASATAVAGRAGQAAGDRLHVHVAAGPA